MNLKTSKSKQTPTQLPELDYRALFQRQPERYIVMRADPPKFTFVDVSDAHASMTGVSRENIIGHPFFEVFPDMSEQYRQTGVSQVRQVLEKVIRSKKPQVLEAFRYDIQDSKGKFVERYWQPTHYPIFDANGNVAFILQSSLDVTEKLATDNRLQETEALLQEALAIGKVGSWLWDIEQNKVMANETLAKLFGVDTQEALHGLPLQMFTDAIHAEDRERVVSEIDAAVASGVPFESEYRVVSTKGVVSWVLARGRLGHAANGKMAIFPGVIVDITERHDFEAQIEEAHLREEVNRRASELLQHRNQELETISRTKDEFVALASHQLRTPATAVKQYVGMVLQDYVGDITPLQREMLDKAFESNERQIQIINQILNAARVDTGRLVMTLAPLDLRAQLEGVIEEMRPDLQTKGHTLVASLGKRPIMIEADPGYLRMALENVIHNAGVYTPSPGRIEVRVSLTTKEVRLSISDNGVGIRQSDLHKLFTKFSRIHNPLSVQAGGSGIGLYLSAEIVRLHSGHVEVESKIHKGTTFTICLPLLARPN